MGGLRPGLLLFVLGVAAFAGLGAVGINSGHTQLVLTPLIVIAVVAVATWWESRSEAAEAPPQDGVVRRETPPFRARGALLRVAAGLALLVVGLLLDGVAGIGAGAYVAVAGLTLLAILAYGGMLVRCGTRRRAQQ